MKKILLILCAILPYADFRVRPYSLEMMLDWLSSLYSNKEQVCHSPVP